MRKTSFQPDCVLVPSELLSNVFGEGSAGEAFPVESSFLDHGGVRWIDSPEKKADIPVGKAGILLAKHVELFFDKGDDRS